jgi:uncharacterized repeat protein (TIGR03803 family)
MHIACVVGRGLGNRSFISQLAAAALILAGIAAHGAPQPSFKVLHSFAGSPNDGAMPSDGQSLAASGSVLYGVTQSGGLSTNGVLFRINNNGSGYAVLRQFNGYTHFLNPSGSKNDGAMPAGTPVVSGSTLYGMTVQGGSNGFGTIYRINTDGGNFAILHHFTSIDNDGHLPQGSLTLAGTTLYGMTPNGGSNLSQGIVFRIETSGAGYEVLHHFHPGQNDGSAPMGSLVVSGTTLYGTTRLAGEFGQGVVFRMNTDGSGYQILRTFTGTVTDGAMPTGSLTLDGGVLYGTTGNGGANNVGTVFRMATNGTGYQILHNFSLGEGWKPTGDVTLVGSTLYGTTRNGGPNGLGAGVIFKVNTDGTGYEALHTFQFTVSGNNGVMPCGALLQADSRLYGMTILGGANQSQGCVFSYSLDGSDGGGGTGTPILGGAFGKLKEVCKTKRGVLGCTVSAQLTMQNSGTGISIPTHLRYFLSADDSFDPAEDVQFGEKKLPKVKPGKNKKLRVKTKTLESTVGRYLLAVDDSGTVLASTSIAIP